MKENKAFRIPFITKKQLRSRQALHRIFFKPQYKVYIGVSILNFNPNLGGGGGEVILTPADFS